MISNELKYSNIKKIYKQLSPHIIETPIIKNSSYLNDFLGSNVFLKLEFFQKTGCFKVRGVLNNIFNLTEKQKINGVTAVSAGNHAIAVAYGANKFSIKNKIFMYETANKYRIDKVKYFKANLFLTNPAKAFQDVETASSNEGFHFIHPFNGKYTIQGTSSLGYEICEQIENIDNVIISVGGGGLIAGVGMQIRQKFPKCKIFGVEPEGAKGLTDSIINNIPLKKVKLNSIADSLCSPIHEEYSFLICKKVINEMINIPDELMKKAMKFMFDHFKFVLEPACVAGIAALMGPLKNKLKNKKTLLILCGSNIDMKSWYDITKNLNS